jgi:type VI protein secretion system component Hcp
METTMSKTNDASNMNTDRELTIDELDAVSGGASDEQFSESIHIDSWSWTATGGGGGTTGGGGLVHEPIHAK